MNVYIQTHPKRLDMALDLQLRTQGKIMETNDSAWESYVDILSKAEGWQFCILQDDTLVVDNFQAHLERIVSKDLVTLIDMAHQPGFLYCMALVWTDKLRDRFLSWPKLGYFTSTSEAQRIRGWVSTNGIKVNVSRPNLVQHGQPVNSITSMWNNDPRKVSADFPSTHKVDALALEPL